MKLSHVVGLALCFILTFTYSVASRAGYSKKGFLVKLSNQKSLGSLKGLKGIKSVESFEYVNKWHHVEVLPGANINALMKEVSQFSDIAEVTPSYFRGFGSQKESTTAKPILFPEPIDKPASPEKWVKESSHVDAAYLSYAVDIWKKGIIGNPDIIIADIDTGVDYNHRDLASNIWRNNGEMGLDDLGQDKRKNGIDDDNNGYIDDYVGYNFVDNNNLPYDDHGHGTHTSGIAAAVGGNNWGTSGVCPRCTIMPLRFISGKTGEGEDADAIRAINYAIKMGAKILNCSWGDVEYSPALFDAFKAADKAGIISVVAAGNDGEDLNFANQYPAKHELPLQMTVAALYPVNVFIPFWSNYSNFYVHFSQAGHEQSSTVPGDKFDYMSGTSMAAPGIAGVAGLIWSYNPSLTGAEVKALMAKNVMGDRDSLGKTMYHGRPDLKEIFKKLLKK